MPWNSTCFESYICWMQIDNFLTIQSKESLCNSLNILYQPNPSFQWFQCELKYQRICQAETRAHPPPKINSLEFFLELTKIVNYETGLPNKSEWIDQFYELPNEVIKIGSKYYKYNNHCTNGRVNGTSIFLQLITCYFMSAKNNWIILSLSKSNEKQLSGRLTVIRVCGPQMSQSHIDRFASCIQIVK